VARIVYKDGACAQFVSFFDREVTPTYNGIVSKLKSKLEASELAIKQLENHNKDCGIFQKIKNLYHISRHKKDIESLEIDMALIEYEYRDVSAFAEIARTWPTTIQMNDETYYSIKKIFDWHKNLQTGTFL